MQPVDVNSLEAEPKDFLCLLSFTDNGSIRWNTSIGNVPRDFLRRMVHVYRASVAISSAFLKVTNDTVSSDDPSAVNQQSEGTKEKATFVKCERDTVILAKQIHHSSDTWFALIGRPLVLRYDAHSHEILRTLEELASILSPSPEGSQENLYHLCDTISSSLKSTWLWNDRGRLTHFVDSLVKFSDKQIAQRKERTQNEPDSPGQVSSSGLQTALKQSLETFNTNVSHYYGGYQVRLCLFSADMKPLYAEKLRRREIDLLGWYFSTCLNLRFQAFSNILSDRDKRGTLRVWYKRHGLTLFTSFLCTKGYNENPPQPFRIAADALLDAMSHAHP